jgi:dephospho-CoA kinase
VHRLREPGAPGYAPLIEALGRDVLLPDGRVDTAALSRKAFQDPVMLARLEHIFRPLVVAEIGQMLQRSVHAVVVIEAIKLLEGDLRKQVDQVWVVDASREQQIRRLMADRGYSREQAVARIEAQNPQADKLAQADVVIRNEGDLAATWRQVLDAWDGVLERLAQAGELPAALVETFVRVSLEQAELPDLPEVVTADLRRLAQAIGSKGRGIAREQAAAFFQ